jgi:hypothetical protein
MTLPARLAPVASMLALAACVAPSDAPRGGQARTGDQSVTVGAEAFLARIAPDAPGLMLTADGAKPVAGQAVAVTRAAGPMEFDEGALAKQAARAGCLAAGGRFQETAIGGYQAAGAWLFRGACA